MFKKTLLAVGVFTLILIISGCGQKSLVENKIENELEKQFGGKAQVDVDNNAINIQTEQGQIQVGGEISLPTDFPADIFIVEGKIVSAMKNVMGAGYQIIIETDKELEEVKSLYTAKLKEQGWTIVSTMDFATTSAISASKDSRQLSITIGSEDNQETSLMVILTLIDNNTTNNLQ
ncbi:MAG TPA: hypothetical protein DEB09_00540 [Candidatus Magasanikbacteria bacterium]|nr:hypothetical protein [Candidatus Magasanikbacteria bacterium]